MAQLRQFCITIGTVALLGGGVAYAQDSGSTYRLNPSLLGQPSQSSLTFAAPSEEINLGFTLSGNYGFAGQVELGRATFADTILEIPEFQFNASGQILEETSIEWNVSPRLVIASGFSRQARGDRNSELQFIEDTFAGGLQLAITPRLRVTAAGRLTMPQDGFQDQSIALSGDTARVGAAYNFLPGLQGSVNYTYESFDGGSGQLDADTESTLSLSVTSQF